MLKVLPNTNGIQEYAYQQIKETHDYIETRPLPNVCEPGQACRDRIYAKAEIDIKLLWKDAVVLIDRIYERGA